MVYLFLNKTDVINFSLSNLRKERNNHKLLDNLAAKLSREKIIILFVLFFSIKKNQEITASLIYLVTFFLSQKKSPKKASQNDCPALF